jgi:hypothetical protein
MTTISYNRIQTNKLNDLIDSLSSPQSSSRFMRQLIHHILIQTGLLSPNDNYFIHSVQYKIKNIILFTKKLYNIYNTCFFPTSIILSNTSHINSDEVYNKLIDVCEPLILLLKFRLQLFEPFQNYENEKLKYIEVSINSLNNHKKCAITFDNQEQKELVLSKIQFYKEQLKLIADEYNIELPEKLKLELSRSERIYQILTIEKKLEEGVSLNIKQIIQNSDLNRYLMEFIE